MRALLLLTTAALLAGGVVPGTAKADALAPDAATKIIAHALHAYGTFQVLRTAPGPADLTAALVSTGKQQAIVWIVGNGQAVLLGRAVGPDGQDLSHQAAVAMGIAPKTLAPAEVAQEVAKRQTILVGSQGPELTAFIDPNCIWCHKLYEDAEPLIKAGKLRLRVLLVGIIKASSPAKAAAILSAKDPVAALAEDEQKFDTANESGGIAPAKHVSPAIASAIDANAKLLAETGDPVTPTLLFKNHAGEWKILRGLPEGGISVVMADMTGATTAETPKSGTKASAPSSP